MCSSIFIKLLFLSASTICVAVPNFFHSSHYLDFQKGPKLSSFFSPSYIRFHFTVAWSSLDMWQLSKRFHTTTLIKQSASYLTGGWRENSFFIWLLLGGPKCWNDLVNWTWRFSSAPQWIPATHRAPADLSVNDAFPITSWWFTSSTNLTHWKVFAELPETHSLITIKHVGQIWIIEGEAEHQAEWWRQ